MKVKELLKGVPGRLVNGSWEQEIRGLTCNSKECQREYAFFAIRGENLDGHAFIYEAVSRGATLVVAERDLPVEAALFVTNDTKKAAYIALRNFYGSPDEALYKVAITGTNGKTTTAYLVHQGWKSLGENACLLSTVEYIVGISRSKPKNTTPGIFELFETLNKAKKEKCSHLVMEASSHALKQGRLGDITFEVAVFTNLSRDHLDYHRDMEDYFESKLLLFTEHLKGYGIVNRDDPRSGSFQKLAKPLIFYGIKSGEVKGRIIEASVEGMKIEIDGKKSFTSLVGRHNLYNVLAAYCVFKVEGHEKEFLEALPYMKGPPGRLERFSKDGVTVFVDYAHTPDALEAVISSVKPLVRGKLIVVFGCGGDRDRGKRPLMGSIVTELADLAIITSDNPRSEEPERIVEDILKGINKKNFRVVIDRKQAIFEAIHTSAPGDAVIVAGKGHEDYQIVKDRVLPFDDREVVKEALGLDSS